MTMTRPDIAYLVSVVSQFISTPRRVIRMLVRILWYL